MRRALAPLVRGGAVLAVLSAVAASAFLIAINHGARP